MLDLEAGLLKREAIHDAHRRSARNLVHYLALRKHDLRPLQSQLALLGLSSFADILTRMQAHHEKKSSMLRQLHLAASLLTTA